MPTRTLFITNFYPPASQGGYEQWCQEVAEELRRRGHDVIVLTSRHKRQELSAIEPDWIQRNLHLEMDFASFRNGIQFFTHRKQREKENLACIQQLIRDFSPNFVVVWGMWNLSRSIPAVAEKSMPGRVVYYMGDYWPTLPTQYQHYWEAPARNGLTSLPKRILGPIALQMLTKEKVPSLEFSHILFPTTFMYEEFKRNGVKLNQTKVIYGAVDTNLYRTQNGKSLSKFADGKLSLLYVGRLTPEKGVHTAIEALRLLIEQHGPNVAKLTIAGTGEADYETELHHLVRQKNLEKSVTFIGAQPKEAMPSIYHQADIFLFTSIWQEPFGRVLVEAMASGILVIGTATGGASDILTDHENALVFAPNNAVDLAEKITYLMDKPQLRQKLTKAGYRTAFEKFDIQRMTTEIETYLQSIVEG
ncbi:MAG: glycosyltransferase family 4 protein [Anaerolineae bacterium]|nr:glycosyltransferase family 4 protein [Anaerolineae bacterium]MCB9107511.1 glycosyltransferase family 4 protein [Anaerolineales bacterium]